VPAVAKSSCRTRASSGTGVAGAVARSVMAPTHNVHSFGASAAKSDREDSNTVTTRKIRFMSAGLKGLMLLNPSSGVKLPPGLGDAARDAGLEVVRLAATVDYPALVRARMNEGRRLFVAAGGDGTVNHLVQALVNTEGVLGVIPIGTYNHFARDLGIPMDWRGAMEIAVSGATKQVDTARANDRFFVNNISMGLYPELVSKREARGRDYPRWKARLYAAYSTLRQFPHVAVTLESQHHQEAIRTHVLMVSNNTYDLSRIGIQTPQRA